MERNVLNVVKIPCNTGEEKLEREKNSGGLSELRRNTQHSGDNNLRLGRGSWVSALCTGPEVQRCWHAILNTLKDIKYPITSSPWETGTVEIALKFCREQ